MDTIKYIDRLILFEKIRNDEIAQSLAGLIPDGCMDFCADSCQELSWDRPERVSDTAIRKIYYAVQRDLLRGSGGNAISGNLLQNHFCRLFASEENAFAKMAEDGVYQGLKTGMKAADIQSVLSREAMALLNLAAREIKHFYPIYRFDFSDVTDVRDGRDFASLTPGGETGAENPADPGPREMIHMAMISKTSLDAAILLADYFHSYGYGVMGQAIAFNAEESGLVPAAYTDPITMDELVGYEAQKRALMENIEILLAGHRANNILLYGDSGTGKSSSIKALLNMYASRGLKLISVSKNKLGLIPKLFDQIASRGLKIVIFIDDLSFEENEYEFKAFKSIIDGRVARSPKNAMLAVTTNRKNIVKEAWSDREGGDDVRRRDSIEEKRSLSDRFGITLTYSAPGKREYLEIVRSIAEKSGLFMPEEKLDAEALKWEIRHGGRSGRTARQFVDYMTGIQSIGSGGFKE